MICFDRLAPAIAGEGVGIAGVDDQRPGRPCFTCSRPSSTSDEQQTLRVNTPATAVPSASST
jgi:hypothetical protein